MSLKRPACWGCARRRLLLLCGVGLVSGSCSELGTLCPPSAGLAVAAPMAPEALTRQMNPLESESCTTNIHMLSKSHKSI